MNDNDIIKALECCGNQMYSCTDKRCKAKTLGEAHDLIIYQKASIERLQHLRAEVSKENEELTKHIDNLRKTINEKANIVKCRNCCHWSVCRDARYGICGYLEDLCGELVHMTADDYCSHGEVDYHETLAD